MNSTIRRHFDNIRARDARVQNAAFLSLIRATDKRVDWAYEVWDDLMGMLTDKDNHVRAIGAQVLCNLAGAIPGAACCGISTSCSR